MIVFVGCGKKKSNYPCIARKLYKGNLFLFSYRYAETFNTDIWILSAKHGLLHPDVYIEPYDLSISQFNKEEIVKWKEKVNQQMMDVGIINKEKLFLAGSKYIHWEGENPLKGLSMGYRIQWLKNKLKENEGFGL